MPTKTIAHLTDIHLGQKLRRETDASGSSKMGYEHDPAEHRSNLLAVLDDIARRGIREIVFGGDIGTKDSIPWFFETLGRRHVDLSVILGNHDAFENVRPFYKNPAVDSPAEMYSSQEDGDFKSIALDSSSNAVSDAQQHWLSEELKTAKQILLFVHHPILEIDTPLDRAGAALKGRSALKHILQQSGREIAIFCGHYHMVDEARSGRIRQYLTPAASYQIVKGAPAIETDPTTFGYRIITTTDDRLDTTVVMLKRAL